MMEQVYFFSFFSMNLSAEFLPSLLVKCIFMYCSSFPEQGADHFRSFGFYEETR